MAANDGYGGGPQNITIAMWYTPAESRGVGVSPLHDPHNFHQINVLLGTRSNRYALSAISSRFNHHHGRTSSFLSSVIQPLHRLCPTPPPTPPLISSISAIPRCPRFAVFGLPMNTSLSVPMLPSISSPSSSATSLKASVPS